MEIIQNFLEKNYKDTYSRTKEILERYDKYSFLKNNFFLSDFMPDQWYYIENEEQFNILVKMYAELFSDCSFEEYFYFSGKDYYGVFSDKELKTLTVFRYTYALKKMER